jgi:hypothetical protein
MGTGCPPGQGSQGCAIRTLTLNRPGNGACHRRAYLVRAARSAMPLSLATLIRLSGRIAS